MILKKTDQCEGEGDPQCATIYCCPRKAQMSGVTFQCAQTRCIPTHFDTSTKVKSAAVRQILFKFWENLLTLKGHFRRNETELEVCYFFLLDTTNTV